MKTIQQKQRRFLEKTVPEILQTALRLTDRHAFMSQSLKSLDVFNSLTLKQVF